MQNVDRFIEELLKDKGETNSESDAKEKLTKQLLSRINEAAVMALSDEKARELSTLIRDPNFSSEQFTKFIQDSGINVEDLIVNTMLEFRKSYLGTEE